MVRRMNTCSEVEHVEVWREVVFYVPPGQMVQVGLMKELPAIPDKTGEQSHGLSDSIQSYEKLLCFYK